MDPYFTSHPTSGHSQTPGRGRYGDRRTLDDALASWYWASNFRRRSVPDFRHLKTVGKFFTSSAEVFRLFKAVSASLTRASNFLISGMQWLTARLILSLIRTISFSMSFKIANCFSGLTSIFSLWSNLGSRRLAADEAADSFLRSERDRFLRDSFDLVLCLTRELLRFDFDLLLCCFDLVVLLRWLVSAPSDWEPDNKFLSPTGSAVRSARANNATSTESTSIARNTKFVGLGSVSYHIEHKIQHESLDWSPSSHQQRLNSDEHLNWNSRNYKSIESRRDNY